MHSVVQMCFPTGYISDLTIYRAASSRGRGEPVGTTAVTTVVTRQGSQAPGARCWPLIMTGHECCQWLALSHYYFSAQSHNSAGNSCLRRQGQLLLLGPAEISRAIKLVLWIILTRFGCGDGDNRNWDIVRKLSRGIIFLAKLCLVCTLAPAVSLCRPAAAALAAYN